MPSTPTEIHCACHIRHLEHNMAYFADPRRQAVRALLCAQGFDINSHGKCSLGCLFLIVRRPKSGRDLFLLGVFPINLGLLDEEATAGGAEDIGIFDTRRRCAGIGMSANGAQKRTAGAGDHLVAGR